MKDIIDVNNPPEDQRGTCPTCNQERLWVGKRIALNALSRKDNKTYICSPCGLAEAMEDYQAYLTSKASQNR